MRTPTRLAAGTTILAALLCCSALGTPVSLDEALATAANYLQNVASSSKRVTPAGLKIEVVPSRYSVADAFTLRRPDGTALCHVMDLDPPGYVVLSADSQVRPVIAYSYGSRFPRDNDPENALLHMLQWDMAARLDALPVTEPDIKAHNTSLWEAYSRTTADASTFADGTPKTTSTTVEQWGAWVTTEWEQGDPYNKFCPRDVVTSNRCSVGCTATAMGQIVNYWQYPGSISFSSPGDDYTFAWDPGTNGLRVMSIDDDCDTPFGTWNFKFDGSDNDKGYISYASGLAHQMRYSSDGSGRPVSADAFTGKFQYASAQRLVHTDCVAPTNFYAILERNVKNGQPAILSVFPSCSSNNTPQYSGGHSIVADGYRATGEYHLNYGWAGSSNGWYFVPTDMPRYGVVYRELVNIHPYVWPMFHQNPAHTARTPHQGAPGNNLRWRYATGDEIGSSPAVARNGTVYVASGDKKLYAIRANGTKQWEFITGGYIPVCSPAIGPNGDIYIGAVDGKLYAVDPATGTQAWVFNAGDEIESSPTVGRDGTIYTATTGSKLYAINPDGSQKWVKSLSGIIGWSSPALDSEGNVYVGAGLTLTARKADGSSKWSHTFTSNEIYSTPAIANDGTIYIGSLESKLIAINPDGTRKWSYTTGGSIYSSPAIGIDGTIYVGSNDNKLHAVNPGGTQEWAFVTGGDVKSSPAIGWDGSRETIYVGSNDNKLYALKTDGTKVWEVRLPDSIVSSPAIAEDGTLYVGCSDQRLYAIGGPNHAPALAWTGEANYVSDGVNPDTTTSSSQTFTFRVKYTDSDNHLPKSGYPKLQIYTSGVEVAGSPVTMSAVDSGDLDCMNGKLYTRPVFGLADGDNYTYSFETYDSKDAAATGGATASKGGPLVDSTPPDTQITGGPNAFIDTGYQNVTFWWDGSDSITPSSSLMYSYKFSDTVWSPWASAKTMKATYGESYYTFYVKARDELGNEDPSPASQTFTVDGSPPSNPDSCSELGGAANDTWQNSVNDPSFTWSGASDGPLGSGLDGYKWFFGSNSGGTPLYYTTNAACNPPSVNNGVYSLRVKTYDALNHESQPATIFTLKYDGTPPGTPSLNGSIGHDWQEDNSPVFSWSASDTGGSGIQSYLYRLGSQSWQSTVTGSKSYFSLSDGTHTFQVKARDTAGNEGSIASYAFKIDTLPPSAHLSITNVGEIRKGDTVGFDATTSSDANGIVEYQWDFDDGSSVYTETAAIAPDGAFDGKTSHPYSTAGVFTVELTVHDPAGNSAKDTRKLTVTSKPEATIDSIIPLPAVGGQRVTFKGTGHDPDGDDLVVYEWTSSIDGILATTSNFNSRTLTPSDTTAHIIQFRVKDSDGFWSDAAETNLWVYFPKTWPMFKQNDARHGYRSTYPDTPHGTLDYAVDWLLQADGPISGSPAAANVDNDWINGLEIAVASTAGTLYLLGSSGSVLWSNTIGACYSSPAIEDINGDGDLDIVIVSTNGVYAFNRGGTNIYFYNAPGASIPGKEFASSPAIADIDQNPFNGQETVVGCHDGSVHAVNAAGGMAWFFTAPGAAFISSPAIADIDPRPGLETVIGGTDGFLYLIDSAGGLITRWSPGPGPGPGPAIDSTPVIADLVDTVPGFEIVFGTDGGYCYCLNYNLTTMSLTNVWQYPASGSPGLQPIDSSPAIHAVGENGVENVVFGCDDGKVYVLRADAGPWGPAGSLETSYDSGAGQEVNSSPAIGDLDMRLAIPGNNLPEVAFGNTNGNLHGISFTLGGADLVPPTPWSPAGLSPGQALDSSPALADINHDGSLEILIGSHDSRLYALKEWAPSNRAPVSVLADRYLGITGQSLTLDASASYDLDETTGDRIVRYAWEINSSGNLYIATTPVISVPWSELTARGITGTGDYPGKCTVYDSYTAASGAAVSTLAIHDSIAPPIALPGGPYSIYAGDSATLDGSASYAWETGNVVRTYAWDLDGDDVYDDDANARVVLSWQELVQFGLGTAGVYAVKLKVTDSIGRESAAGTTTLTVVHNSAPQVDANGPYEIEVGSAVSLAAFGSDPDAPADSITQYTWDINGNGVFGEFTGTNPVVSWAYLSAHCPGRGQGHPTPLRVRAYDEAGDYGTSPTAHLYIYTNTPIAVARANGSQLAVTVRKGAGITFDHAASHHDWTSQHTIVSWAWDFDHDGTNDWTTSDRNASQVHSFSSTGTYHVALAVTDDNIPPHNATDTIQVTVSNRPPVASPGGPYRVPYTAGLTLNAGFSKDPDGAIVMYEWDLDDDGDFDDRTGVQPSLTWAELQGWGITDSGSDYPIALRATDDDGATGIASGLVTVVARDVVMDDPTATAAYSDETVLSLSITDVAGAPLVRQAALPKAFYLEVSYASTWHPLAADTVSSPGDTDALLSFVFSVNPAGMDLQPGEYPVRARFEGDTDYGPATRSGTLRIEREEVVLGGPQAVAVFGNDIVVQVTARDDENENLAHQFPEEKVMYLEVNTGGGWLTLGEDRLSAPDDSDFLLDYTAPTGPGGVDLGSGDYALRVRFDGDAYYAAGSATGVVSVVAKSAQILDNLDMPDEDWTWNAVYTEPVTLSCTMLDTEGSNLLHQADEPKTVTLEINEPSGWNTLAAFTLGSPDDSETLLPFTCMLTEEGADVPPGSHDIRFRFDGDSRYGAVLRTGMLSVSRQNTAFVDPGGDWTWAASIGSLQTLSVQLVDTHGEPLQHLGDAAKVIYADYFDGGEWRSFASTAITDPSPTGQSAGMNGHLQFWWLGGEGTFTIRFRFDGDAYYNGTSQNATLDVPFQAGSVLSIR